MATEKTPAEIEREIEAERAGLARSLEELQSQFSPEAIVNSATTYVRNNGGDIAATIGRQIKENPMAAALTGIGLVWLMVGSGRRNDRATYAGDVESDPQFRSAYGEPEHVEPQLAYDDRRYASAPGTLAEPHRPGFEDRLERVEDDRDEYTVNADHGLEDAQVSSPEMARLEGRSYPEHGRVYSRSADMRARLSQGTERMSETARLRVMQARQRAYEAQRGMEEKFGDYKASGRRAYYEQPLLGGVIALGIGAVIGAALPRTEREDEAFGAYRDRALGEADRIFREESAKLRAVAEAAIDEVKDIGQDAMETAQKGLTEAKSATPTGREAVAQAEGVVGSAARRVADAAKAEAEKQDLGGSVKS
ncbi:MAG: DUF3618 domain-containing protein [Pseudomonadota bacterium]